MKKNLIVIFAALFCCLSVAAQPYRGVLRRRPHHTNRLPGVNEHRLARLEKMRNANLQLRHAPGPLRAKTQPESKRGLVLLVQFSDMDMQSGASAQWKSRFNQQGYALNSRFTHCLVKGGEWDEDPMFVDVEEDDYHLQEDSPAQGIGYQFDN